MATQQIFINLPVKDFEQERKFLYSTRIYLQS